MFSEGQSPKGGCGDIQSPTESATEIIHYSLSHYSLQKSGAAAKHIATSYSLGIRGFFSQALE
jgi:hypothetical protein